MIQGPYIAEYPGPDYIAISDTDWETPMAPGVYPHANASMSCYEAPSQCNSLFDFGLNSATAISGTITITAVPEPSTLVLLGAGLLGATVATRREGLRG